MGLSWSNVPFILPFIMQNWNRGTHGRLYFMNRFTFFAENFWLPKSYSQTEIHIFQPCQSIVSSSQSHSKHSQQKTLCRHVGPNVSIDNGLNTCSKFALSIGQKCRLISISELFLIWHFFLASPGSFSAVES